MADHDSKERLLKYLVAGATQAQAASALGLSESYVSDLHSEDGFKAELAARKLANLEQHITVDNTIRSVESAAITKLKTLLPMVMDPMKVLAIFKVANSARSSQQVNQNPTVAATTIVNLQLPTAILQTYKSDSMGKIISIGETPMVTLQSANVERLAESYDNIRKLETSKHTEQFALLGPSKENTRSTGSSSLAEFGLA
jgi:hypothetical protein